MIYARPGHEFVAYLIAPTGLVGSLSVKAIDEDANIVIAAATTGVTEIETGLYAIIRTAPSPDERTVYAFTVTDVSADPDVLLADDLIVSAAPPDEGSIDDIATWPSPSLRQVAAYLPTRTRNGQTGAIERDDFGYRTFNENTNPTDVDVLNEIAIAKQIIVTDVGASFCTDASDSDFPAKSQALTALYAAMLVELGHFPEQVATDRSPYPNLKILYDDRRERLRSEIEEICGDVPGADDEEGTVSFIAPEYNFDKPVSDLGFGTVW